DGVPIAGKTTSAYTLNPATDAGHTIQCRITATGGGGGATQGATPAWVIAPSPATPPPLAPQSIAAPSANGVLSVGGPGGQTLKCDPGAWGGAPSFEYRWYRNGAPIAAAEAPEYSVQAADLTGAAYFQCASIATTSAGPGATVVETSEPLATDPAPEAPVSRPNMIGSGEVLYASGDSGDPRAVCILPGGIQSNGCSAGIANPQGFNDGRNNQVTGAISSEGDRVFWTDSAAGLGRIYLRQNPTAPQSALALGQATGAGKRTSGSPLVEEVSTASGAFAPGQRIIGEGIP